MKNEKWKKWKKKKEKRWRFPPSSSSPSPFPDNPAWDRFPSLKNHVWINWILESKLKVIGVWFALWNSQSDASISSGDWRNIEWKEDIFVFFFISLLFHIQHLFSFPYSTLLFLLGSQGNSADPPLYPHVQLNQYVLENLLAVRNFFTGFQFPIESVPVFHVGHSSHKFDFHLSVKTHKEIVLGRISLLMMSLNCILA